MQLTLEDSGDGVIVFRHESRLRRWVFYPVREFKAHHLARFGVCLYWPKVVWGKSIMPDYLPFRRVWQPSFIGNASFTDCCHLNGMATDEQKQVRYVTAFSQSNKPGFIIVDLLKKVIGNVLLPDGADEVLT